MQPSAWVFASRTASQRRLRARGCSSGTAGGERKGALSRPLKVNFKADLDRWSMISAFDGRQIPALEAVISAFYGSSAQTMQQADVALNQFREYWLREGPYKLLGLACTQRAGTPTLLWVASLVEQWLRTRWRRLSQDERSRVREAVAAAATRGCTAPFDREATVRTKRLEALLAQVRATVPKHAMSVERLTSLPQ